MKLMPLLIPLLVLSACSENGNKNLTTKQKTDSCKICYLVKDWQFYQDDSARHKNKMGFQIGNDKFLLEKDSSGHSKGFRYDNDSLIGFTNDIDHEFFNSQKGLYFFGEGETKNISYATPIGLGFSIDYNSKQNNVQKIELFDKEILLNDLKNNKIYLVIRNENGVSDTMTYSPTRK